MNPPSSKAWTRCLLLVVALLAYQPAIGKGGDGAWAATSPIPTSAHAASLFGGRILSEGEAAEIYGSTTATLSPSFSLYLWDGFTLPIPSGVTAVLSAPFELAVGPGFQPPDSGFTAGGASAAFVLITTSGQLLPGLVGADLSPGTAVYLAGGFRASQMGQYADQTGPLFPLNLGRGFASGDPGNIGITTSALFPVYLARGFVRGMTGETGVAIAFPFELRLTPSGDGGLITDSSSPSFSTYLAADFLLPRDVLTGDAASAIFELILNSSYRLPPPQLVHAVASPAFEAFLVPDFVPPLPSLRADAPSPPFALALLALAGGREGFALSPPFELNLYVFPTPVLASLVDARYADGMVRISWEVHEAGVSEFLVSRTVGDAGWQHISGLALDGPDRLSLEDSDVHPGWRYGYRLMSAEDATVTLSEVWFDIPRHVLSLLGAVPNPTPRGRLLVRFTLPDASPAKLEVLDVAGRRVAHEEVGSYGPGAHTIDLGQGRRLPAGIYWVRLSTPARSLVRKAHVLN